MNDDKFIVICVFLDSLDEGMASSCRETFTGVVVVFFWCFNDCGECVEIIIDVVMSDIVCLEIGGGFWIGFWCLVVEIRLSFGSFMGLFVDVRVVVSLFLFFGDVFFGL